MSRRGCRHSRGTISDLSKCKANSSDARNMPGTPNPREKANSRTNIWQNMAKLESPRRLQGPFLQIKLKPRSDPEFWTIRFGYRGSALPLASRKRCDLKTRKRCDFYSAAQKVASDFSAISSAIFWRFFCDFCGKTCDLVLCDLKTQRFFCDCDFLGR